MVKAAQAAGFAAPLSELGVADANGLVKGFHIERNGAQEWTNSALAVVGESCDANTRPLLTMAEVQTMEPGDRLPLPDGSVFCNCIGDLDWLDALPDE